MTISQDAPLDDLYRAVAIHQEHAHTALHPPSSGPQTTVKQRFHLPMRAPLTALEQQKLEVGRSMLLETTSSNLLLRSLTEKPFRGGATSAVATARPIVMRCCGARNRGRAWDRISMRASESW